MIKLWKQNRVLFMLIVILVVCFISICSVALTFFYSHESSVYGERLDNIEKHPIKNKLKDEFKEKALEYEHVSKVSMNVKGKVVYIHFDFDDEIDIEKAKETATKSLELLGEDIVSYYDIEFVLNSSNFTIIGAKNAIIDHVSWNNNMPVKEDEDTPDEES